MGEKNNALFNLGGLANLDFDFGPGKISEKESAMMKIISDQQAALEEIKGSSFYLAIVLLNGEKRIKTPETDKLKPVYVDTVLISTQNGTLTETPNYFKLKPGDVVKCVMTKGDQVGIVDVYTGTDLPFTTSAVKKVEGCLAYIEGGDPQHPGSNTVYCGSVVVKAGDTVKILFGRVVVGIVPESKEMSYSFSEATGVDWDDIAGLEEAKKQIIEALEYPITYKDFYAAYGKKRSKGLLFYGPPGNGKTMLGKAAATSIAKLYKGEPGFIYIKGPELLNSYVGATEGKIRKLFSEARSFYIRTGNPAIIFIDEADAILPRRGSGRSSDVEKTIVPQFLAEMDGLDESGAVVILATNRPESLDEAVLREGRVDKKIRIPRPDKVVASAILKICLKKTKLAEPLEEMVNKAVEKMFSPDFRLYEVSFLNGTKGVADYCYFNLLSGATVASLGQDAIFTAMMRDINSGGKNMTGIGYMDLEQAILESFGRYKQLDYTVQILQEYVEKGIQVLDCQKVGDIIKPSLPPTKAEVAKN